MSTISIERERALKKKLNQIFRRDVSGSIADFAAPKSKSACIQGLFLEGIHFDLAYTTALELGNKLLTVLLNRMSSAGVRPKQAGISLGIRQDTHEFFVSEFCRGIQVAARKSKIEILSLDITSSPSFLASSIFVTGIPPKKKKQPALKDGDVIAVSGTLGTSAAALDSLKRIGRDNLHNWETLTQAHLNPPNQIAMALKLYAASGIKRVGLLAEGLARELNDFCGEWKFGARVKEASLPVSEATHWAGRSLNMNPLRWAVYGGEDQQLLVVLDRAKSGQLAKRWKLTEIGSVVAASKKVQLIDSHEKVVPLLPRNWSDFVRRSAPLV